MTWRPPDRGEIPTAAALVAEMDRTVAGLDDFKRRLAVLLHRHMVAAWEARPERPPNALVIGESGGGKTHTLRAALEACPVPWVEVNATEYSDVGYIGRDLVSMYHGLAGPRWRGDRAVGITPMHEYVPLVERYGVVVIDEFDKLRGTSKPGERQVGRALQAELLKLVEGAEVQVKRGDSDRGFSLQTHGILHIACGAFEGLGRVVAKELDVEEERDTYTQAHPEDIVHYGFLEELAGRFSYLLMLPPLGPDHLARVLREHVLPAYVRQLADDGVSLAYDEGTLMALVGMAGRTRIGARALRPAVEECLWRPWSLAQPGDTIVLTAEHVGRKTGELIREDVA